MPSNAIPSRRWIWFFAVLAVLTIAAIVLEFRSARGQLLTPELLAQARALWHEKGPADYDMTYTIKRGDEPPETYEVKVRQQKVVSVERNGSAEEERLYRYSGMPALFSFIGDFLDQDAQPGTPRTYASATFDAADGHLLRYVRSVLSKKERQEIVIQRFERR